MLPPELLPRYSPYNDLLSLPLSENAHASMRTAVFQCLGVFTRKAVWFYGCRQIRFRIIRAYKNPRSGNRIGGISSLSKYVKKASTNLMQSVFGNRLPRLYARGPVALRHRFSPILLLSYKLVRVHYKHCYSEMSTYFFTSVSVFYLSPLLSFFCFLTFPLFNFHPFSFFIFSLFLSNFYITLLVHEFIL